jgi:hypothetical protein
MLLNSRNRDQQENINLASGQLTRSYYPACSNTVMRKMEASAKIVFLLLILILTSCNKRYKLSNMVPEEIDVTNFIESGDYLPDSCKGQLNRLTRIHNSSYQIDTLRVKQMIVQWTIDNHIESTQDITYSSPKYKYTYFITTEPIDVYSISFRHYLPAPKDYRLYFRIDNTGKLISGLSTDSWVTTKCDGE